MLADSLAQNSNQKISILHKNISSRERYHLILNDNEIISFDKLVIATGSSPIKPTIEGIDNMVFI